MSDVRISDVDCTIQILNRGKITSAELRAVLVDKLQGVGGRYPDLIEFLETIGLIKQTGHFVELVEASSSEPLSDLVTRKMLTCGDYARDFVEHCKLVEVVELERRSISISASHTSYYFIWFLLTLEQLGVLKRQYNSVFVVTSDHLENFFEFISYSLTRIEDSASISPEELKAQQLANAAAGLSAELYVMDFERQRLDGHALLDKIKHIALRDVTAGYDILSFEDVNELMPRRRIEVKSWSGQKRFYFSENEMRVAKKIGDNYYVYLVDRSRMGKVGYSPEIYPNPLTTFFGEKGHDEWKIEPDGWLLTHEIVSET